MGWPGSGPSCGSTAFLSARQLTGPRPAPSLGCHKDRRCGCWCASLCGCVFVSLCPCKLWHRHQGSPHVVHSGLFTAAPGVEAGLVTEPRVSTGPVPTLLSRPAVKEHKSPSYRHNKKTDAVLTDPQSYSYYRTIQSIILLESTILNTFQSGCLLP